MINKQETDCKHTHANQTAETFVIKKHVRQRVTMEPMGGSSYSSKEE